MMERHKYITLPCQYCEKPERRVSWRESNAVTCFECKTVRRSELAKLKLKARRLDNLPNRQAQPRTVAMEET
jgi:hypothetical protein